MSSKTKRQPSPPPQPPHTLASLADKAAELGIIKPPAELEALAAEALKQEFPVAYLEHLAAREESLALLQTEIPPESNELSGETIDPPGETNLPTPEPETHLPEIDEEQIVRVNLTGIPLGEIDPDSHVRRHLDMNLAGPHRDLAVTLKRLCEGLYRAGEKLPNDKAITGPADAVRWLLYQVKQAQVAPAK